VRTEDLLAVLATGAEAVDGRGATRRLLIAVGLSTAVALALTAGWLGIRPTLIGDFAVPMFWVKEGFCVALGASGLAAVARIARPGRPLGLVPVGVAAPILFLWLLAAADLSAADAQARVQLILGHTSDVCSWRIAFIAFPVFVAMFWVFRQMAPTRSRLAGAAAGFTAGAIGALAYSLHCPELAAPFIAIWYLLGVLVPTIIGTLLGSRLLRW
jgi:hypothetical protein